MTSLKFQLRISFLFYVWLSHNLVKEIWVVHMTLRSYKISCDIEGHVDLWGQLQGKCIFFRNRWICQFITPSISSYFIFFILSLFFFTPHASLDFSLISQPISMKFGMVVVRDEAKRCLKFQVNRTRGRDKAWSESFTMLYNRKNSIYCA